ncbi:MAG: MFS transporter [Spirochaetes bacterium]|nr:MFS transporter [Spirochaetota bacterium]
MKDRNGTIGAREALDRNVVVTGVTSFFTDIASEMIYPLIQAFVAMVMAGHKVLLGPVLGVIEGVAESTASLVRVASGYYSDRIRRRKEPVIAGYGLSAIGRVLLLAGAAGWWFILLARFLDRVGKGIRTAPRDALISDSTAKEGQGRAFGFQRAMDFAGAFLGALLCYFAVRAFMDPATGTLGDLGGFYTLFLVSLVPAAAGIAALFFIREKAGPKHDSPGAAGPMLDIRKYDRNLRVFFLSQFIFTMGNSSNQFLLLRSMDLGHALSTVVLMYLSFNLSSSALSYLFGSWSDSLGRKKILMAGYLLYAVVYSSFGFLTLENASLLWLFWPLYGVYYAMTEGVEKAFVCDIAPGKSRATALGFHQATVGIGLLPASLIAGVLFAVNPGLPFLFGGAMAVAAVVVLAFGVRAPE